jgi:adenine/guanine phosphoribosyltransferase-like PRPP-binding protein
MPTSSGVLAAAFWASMTELNVFLWRKKGYVPMNGRLYSSGY